MEKPRGKKNQKLAACANLANKCESNCMFVKSKNAEVENKIRNLLKNASFIGAQEEEEVEDEEEEEDMGASTSSEIPLTIPVAKIGYLSHDYWPSLFCVSDSQDYIRFFNLTNTRNQGNFRYYRCSKCTSLKSLPSISSNIDQDMDPISSPDISAPFSVPKIRVDGMTIVTDFSNLKHHSECRPIPIPAMIADQLDRRARRQVSLGLLEPREAWTQAYFEALRISAMVTVAHPSLPTVADFFPSYELARVQYNRHFHKGKRCFSQSADDVSSTSKRKRNFNESFTSPTDTEIDPKEKASISTKIRISSGTNHLSKDKSTKQQAKNDHSGELLTNKSVFNRLSKAHVWNNKSNNNEPPCTSNCVVNEEENCLIIDGYFESGNGADIIFESNCVEPVLSMKNFPKEGYCENLRQNRTSLSDNREISSSSNVYDYRYEEVTVGMRVEDELITSDTKDQNFPNFRSCSFNKLSDDCGNVEILSFDISFKQRYNRMNVDEIDHEVVVDKDEESDELSRKKPESIVIVK